MPPEAGPSGETPTDRAAYRSLAGNLPCVRCRYNLRGLSVITRCPECGTPIRATVLAAVDPLANLLRPIPWRRITATGLVCWAGGALAAAGLTWALTAADTLHSLAGLRLDDRFIVGAALGAIVTSGLGACVLLRPHAGIPARQIAAAAAGVAAYIPFAWTYARIHAVLAAGGSASLIRTDTPWPERSLLRLGATIALLVMIVGLRPNARLLAARSVLLREGRVDRQTLLVMALVLVFGALGDGLHLFCAVSPTRFDSVLVTAGTLIIGVSSMLFTVGLGGVLIDVWRIRHVVLQPAPTFIQLVGEPRREPGTEPGANPRDEGGGDNGGGGGALEARA